MEKTIVRATPAARYYAREHNINLSLVRGTGAKGRVHKCDVISYKLNTKVKISPLARRIAEIEGINLKVVRGTGPNGKIMKSDLLAIIGGGAVAEPLKAASEPVKAEPKVEIKQDKDIEVVPMTPMRKVIAKRMSESYFTAPTFMVDAEVDMTKLLALRSELQESIVEETGVKASVTDFVSLAVIKALMKHPYVNCTLSEDQKEIYLHKYVNLAIAVGTDTGLLVPVVNGADKMSLKELVVESKEMITKTLEGKLKPQEMSGSTFTISNLGMYGVKRFCAIINQPNSGILAVSATEKRAVVVGDDIVIRPMMTISLTADHRVVDGLEGAKFMQTLKKMIENPVTLLI